MPGTTLKNLCTELGVPWATTKYCAPLGVVYGVCIWRVWGRLRPTVEGAAFDRAYKVAFAILVFLLGAEIVRFVTLSGRLLRFLRDLAAEPMIDAYDRIAKKVSGSFGLQLSARVPEPRELQVSVLSARTLTNLLPSELSSELELATRELEQRMDVLNGKAGRERDWILCQRRVHKELFRVASLLHGLLGGLWRKRAERPDLDEAVPEVTRRDLLPLGEHAHSPTALVLMGAVPTEVYLWMRQAEDFVAMRTSTFIYQVLHELRHTLVFCLGAAAMLAASVASYPFQPWRFLTLCGWSSVVAVVAVGFVRMLALERNEILSRLGGTKPDRIEWNAAFVRQLVIYVVFPLVVAILGLFPGLSEFLASRLAPLVRILPSSY